MLRKLRLQPFTIELVRPVHVLMWFLRNDKDLATMRRSVMLLRASVAQARTRANPTTDVACAIVIELLEQLSSERGLGLDPL
jgi:hypothetical protein